MKHDRPLSPHIQIYKPQLTSVLSITHRATGLVLFGASFLMVSWLIYGTHASCYGCFIKMFSTFLGKALLSAVFFSFVYHFFNGIRHLLWDTGWGLEIKTTYITGWLTLAVSFLSTVLLMTQL